MVIRQVCVYCGSSRGADPAFHEAAYRLGQLLARESIAIVYGGGAFGSMGKLAQGALECDGTIIGILPRLMQDLEWGHSGLTELKLVDDLHERKRLMIENAGAVIALPGGSGTLEELLEVITLKRLGLYLQPIVLVNVRRFFDPLTQLLERSISERFMDDRHRAMWSVVNEPDQVLQAIREAPEWTEDARGFATI